MKIILLLALFFLLPNFSKAAILESHPRIWQDGGMPSELRAKACRDVGGNVVGGCTPSAQWVTYYNFMNTYRTSGSYYGMSAWHFALLYQITKETDFATRAKDLAMAEISNGFATERFDQYLYVHAYLMNASITYDFLYDNLSAGERDQIRDYLNQLLHELWNHDNNPYNTWPGWAVDDGANNYFYHHIDGTAYAALALHNENPLPPPLAVNGTSYSTILDFLYAKINQQGLLGYLDAADGGVGGGWHEGTGYGLVSKMYMAEAFWTLKKSGAADYFSLTDFPREASLFQLYSIQPESVYKYPGGDLPNNVEGALRQYERWLTLLLARGLEGSVESRYAQYWTQNVMPSMTNARELYPWDFILTKSDLPMSNFNTLPFSYHASGLGWMNSRSGWQDDAVSVSFVCTDRKQSHQHADQNSFVIYKNGWQAIDANEASSGLLARSIAHNTLLINNEGQRYAADMASLLRYDSINEYTYASGDASNAYWAGAGDWGEGTTTLLNSWIREFVHVQPNYVVVYDKVSPINSAYSTKYLLHFPNQPIIDQNLVTGSNGQGKLFQRTLLPSSYNLQAIQNTDIVLTANGWRVVLTPQVQQADNYFLNVLETDASSANSPVATSLVTSSGSTMQGALIQDLTKNSVVLFATNSNAKPLTGAINYQAVTNRVSQHLLIGLRENYAYRISSSTGLDLEVATSAQGVLKFDNASIGNITYTISETGAVLDIFAPSAPSGLLVL